MTDYAKLADIAELKMIADRTAVERHRELRAASCTFFEGVKARLADEMNKANTELRKKKVPTIDRLHLANFDEEVFLTYGTDSLCRVGLGIMSGGCRITAVISGPPNGYEISRREYLCVQEASCSEVLHLVGAELTTVVACPDEIAVNIISGILVGKFN
jgi:hypothetical protein